MTWGGFAGGFSQGFKNGVNIANEYEQASKERDLKAIRDKGMEEANAKRQAEIDGMVKENAAPVERQEKVTQAVAAETPQASSAPNEAQFDVRASGVAQPVATSPTTPQASGGLTITPLADSPQQVAAAPASAQSQAPQATQPSQPQQASIAPIAANGMQGNFMVGNQSFATREQAQAAAAKKVPNISEYVMNSITPKMQEYYIANGEVEKAESLGRYMESSKGREATQLFGKAMNKLMFTDDLQGGIDALGEYYNKHVDDGVTFGTGKRLDDGRISITLKNKDGKDSEMVLTQQELLRLGMAHDPAKLFDLTQKQAATAEASKAELAKENRTAMREDARDKRNHSQAIELKSIDAALDQAKASSKTRREIGGKVEALRDAGYSDEFINGVMPGIIGVGDYKKGTSPEEAKRLALSDRMKNDPTFSRKPRAEQQAIIDGDMALVYGGVKPSSAPTANADAPSPAAGGITGAAPKGKPMFDTVTGKIVIR
jgi:hypothetical protein